MLIFMMSGRASQKLILSVWSGRQERVAVILTQTTQLPAFGQLQTRARHCSAGGTFSAVSRPDVFRRIAEPFVEASRGPHQ